MKSMLHRSFNPSKCKTTLKLAVSRIKLVKNKKGIQLTQLKREVGQLLSSGQDQTAMIRVEHVVREEKTVAAFDLIEVYCELVVARLPIIESQKICPMDLKEAVSGIIFAAPRCADIPELKDISKHLTAKYGKDFVSAAVELRPDSGVNRILVEKLSAKAPDGPTKVKILTTIAEENGIKWEFKEKEPEASPQGFSSNFPGNVSYSETAQNFDSRKGAASASFGAAAASSDSMHGPPSNIYHTGMSGSSRVGTGRTINQISNVGPSTKQSYSSVNSSGDESNKGWPNPPANKVSDATYEGRSNYNMGFKDATDAANAAARSAEEASRAARAAAELASHGRRGNSAHSVSISEVDYAQKEDDDRYYNGAFRDEAVKNDSADCSLPERDPRVKEYVVKESSRQNKTFETASEVGSKSDLNHYVQPSAHMSYEHGNPAKQAEDEENVRPSKLSPKKEFHKEEFQSDTERNNAHVFPSRDSNQAKSSSDSADLSDYASSSHLVSRREDTSADNPFFLEPTETKNDSSRYQYGDVREDYSAFDSNTPVFDDDPHEDPFVVLREKETLKEDWELRDSYNHTVIDPYSYSYNQKESALLQHPEQKIYGFEPSDDQSPGIEQGRMNIDKEHMHTDTHVNAVFDDYDSDDVSDLVGKEDGQRSPSRNLSSPEKSPVSSSREPEKTTAIWDRQSSSISKHLYQPELTESFKNSPLFFQLDKPVHISFDDEDDDKEGKEEATKSKGRKKLGSIGAHFDSPKAETEFDSELLHPEPLVEKPLSEESYQLRSGNLLQDNFSAGDLYTHEQQGQTLGYTKTKESLGVIDKESDIESSPKLNTESLPRGRRNVGLLQPPYIKNLGSTSASSRQSFDVSPKESHSNEWEELPSQSNDTHQKTTGSDPDYNTNRYVETGVRNSNSRHQVGAFDDFEGLGGSQDEDTTDTTTSVHNKGARVVAGVSRRTRASRESIAASFQEDSKPPYVPQSAPTESVLESVPSSSASSHRAAERAQLLRWAEEQASFKPTCQQPQNSDGEEIVEPKQEIRYGDGGLGSRQMGNQRPSYDLSRRVDVDAAEHIPSVESNLTSGLEDSKKPVEEKKQLPQKDRSTRRRVRKPSSELPTRVEAAASEDHKPKLKIPSQEENVRAAVVVKEIGQTESTPGEAAAPSGSCRSTEDSVAPTSSRDDSMKRASHVHPKLPDFDTLADRIRSLNMDQRK